jgi:hypothetical protein
MRNRAWMLLVGLFLGAGACATVHPPANPQDPVAVYLTNYGVHSSLILPLPRRRQFVEYCFGDWGYAVENHDSPFDAIGALTVSNGSAFGRRILFANAVDIPITVNQSPYLHRIYAARGKVYALEQFLDDRFQSNCRNGARPTTNPDTGITFVSDSQHYSILNNCNQLTASCLEKLGCRVDGVVVTSLFEVTDP